jgi:NAD-dependent deacetylase
MMTHVNVNDYRTIVFFTGAGMSAESGVPTYRGKGGIWHQYNWQEFACQEAFEADPEKVLAFHELRRKAVLACKPHEGHYRIAALEKSRPGVAVITQNIDGMHQRGGSRDITELHGSLWRVRCSRHGVREDLGETFAGRRCDRCGEWLRPDIVWFGDHLDQHVMEKAMDMIGRSELFVSIGTSGAVWPAAGFPQIAKNAGACCLEINPEANEMSHLYDASLRLSASEALTQLIPESQS